MVLAETVRNLLQQGVESIVLDLQNVSYVDSFGLGELAEANAIAHNRGGTLRLCHVPGRLARLLTLTRLDSVFECVIDD
jgi:anti-anti-sigma factor